MNIFKSIRDIFRIEELRKRLMRTAIFAIIFRLGTFILLPGLNRDKLLTITNNKAGMLNFLQSLTGSPLKSYSIFSLGVGPYISASIMVQIATFAIPYFSRLQKEGAAGRAKLTQITRWLTFVVAIAQGVPFLYNAQTALPQGDIYSLMTLFYMLVIVTGTMFCVWLGDRITEKGLSNGTSVLMMVGIISELPTAFIEEFKVKCLSENLNNPLFFVIELVILFFIIMSVVAFMLVTRRIPLQYAKQMIGGVASSYGGSRQFLPLKMNASGVMPIIFANMFIVFITFIAKQLEERIDLAKSLYNALRNQGTGDWRFNALQAILIFIGAFMYTAVFVNPTEIANQLKLSNGFIPGVKPGKSTALFIDKVISRITFPGALFLAIVAMVPPLAKYAGVGIGFSRFYGGSSMLIIVGVILEMGQQIESHLSMLYYDKMVEASLTTPKLL